MLNNLFALGQHPPVNSVAELHSGAFVLFADNLFLFRLGPSSWLQVVFEVVYWCSGFAPHVSWGRLVYPVIHMGPGGLCPQGSMSLLCAKVGPSCDSEVLLQDVILGLRA